MMHRLMLAAALIATPAIVAAQQPAPAAHSQADTAKHKSDTTHKSSSSSKSSSKKKSSSSTKPKSTAKPAADSVKK
ncbi:MAG TPA: hypothetical protein VLT79_06025 [Gemmatimonadales bacterium]|nr:hypothetical protein [Gemmatimonadales bacterium]